MTQKGLKASEIADATGITRPVMSRYLANRTGISAENLITLSQYLNVSPDWLLNGSDAPEAVKMSKSVSVDKNTIIEVQRELIERLKKDVGRLEAVVKKTKNPTKPNKQKVGFMKKHKPKKWYNVFVLFLSAISAFQNFDVSCDILKNNKLITLEE